MLRSQLLTKRFNRPAPVPATGFAVDAVVPAHEAILTETLEVSLKRRFRRGIMALPDASRTVTNACADELLKLKIPLRNLQDVGSRIHPLIDAVHVAFSRHYPLTLSPDAIWLIIAQGFGHHVSENASTLRPRLVGHEGKRRLSEKISSLTPAEFERAIAAFSAQIQNATDPVLHETLICDFSTTTPAIRTASQVAIMDTFSSYFEYRIGCVCGIPRITLTGCVEDWERIRARVEVLETYDLGWWVPRLRPILDEFVLAAAGNPNTEFWKAIYKPEPVYGAEVATGWIADLFPYLGDTVPRPRNPVLEEPRHEWGVPVRSGLVPTQFPSGQSSAPVEIAFPDESKINADLVAGFFAVEQDPQNLALSPLISWSVTEPPPQKPIILLG